MEIETALTTLGGTYASARMMKKLLGPTADYLGGSLRDYTGKGMDNLSRIFGHAVKTLGDRLEVPGQVPPRVLKGILEEGYFCEDELSAKYFGGVLASSRSGVRRDDRAASFVALMSRLSVYQIRTHYILYSVFRSICSGWSLEMGVWQEGDKSRLFIPWKEYVKAMDFRKKESIDVLITHVFDGLVREKLTDESWCSGSARHLKDSTGVSTPSAGILYTPAPWGIELYLWAHGCSEVSLEDFLLVDLPIIELADLEMPARAKCYEE